MSNLIDRQAAIDALKPWLNVEGYSEGEVNMLRAVLYELKTLPTAEPEQQCDEWCTGCREYDQENHSCPRFNRVIRQAVDDLKQSGRDRGGWILVSERLPKTSDDVLVTDGEAYAVGYWREDAQAWDSCDFGWLENREEPPCGIGKVIAWRPLPELPEGDDREWELWNEEIAEDGEID